MAALKTCEFHGGLPESTYGGDTKRTKCGHCVAADNDRKERVKNKEVTSTPKRTKHEPS